MTVITVLMTVATIALSGIGGLYYTYACSVMPGLRATDDATFVSAMSRINAAIQNPLFALSFFGALLGLGAVVWYSWTNELASTLPAAVALLFYLATMVITSTVNIPLNNRLGRAIGQGQSATARQAFERSWTRWNIHRMLLSLAAIVSLSVAWAALGSS